MGNTIEDRLKNYLNLYWLRPENGLLQTFKSKVFEDFEITSPSLEISCGDGLFYAIHLDGKFREDFDYFQSTKAQEFSHNSFVDIYDHYDENYNVPYIEKPTKQFDYGTDWKQALLDKAAKAQVHKNLILHDNNKLPLPFQDNFFKTIYSNSVYWVQNVKDLLADIYRITSPGGLVALEVMTPHMFETLKEMENFFDKDAISILDRKRRETMPGLYDYDEWNKRMNESGFKIVKVKSVYPNKILLDIWNIGLRPISHLLIQMSDKLSTDDKRKIKKEWVDIFYKIFKPLLQVNQSYTLDKSPYLYYLLKKE